MTSTTVMDRSKCFVRLQTESLLPFARVDALKNDFTLVKENAIPHYYLCAVSQSDIYGHWWCVFKFLPNQVSLLFAFDP